MLGPVPGRLVAMLNTVLDNPEWRLYPVQEVGAGKVEVSALLTLVDLLDDSF